MSFDDFKSFHFAPVDNYYMNPQKLGYNLSNGTVYYYKIEICDPSSNCGVSSCLNFTTASAYSTFLAKIQPPSGFSMSIPALGVSGDNMSNSIPVNATQTKNINITINCPDAGYSITFVNVSFASTKSITLSNVTCNATSKLMGMPTSSWQKDIVTTLGSPQEILLTYNIPYANFSALQSCTDEGLNCTNVTTYANCTGNTTTTVCRVPITLGFSTYKVVTVAATTTTTTTSSSGGGGGGGGASAAAGLKKVSYSVINTGAATVIKDFDKDSGLKEIQITVRNKVQNVQITILKLSTKPASVTEPAKMTYKYIEINKTNVSETDLSEVKIKFEVNKTWLSTNGFATGDVSLYRYTTTWNKLTTALTGSDSNYYFYEATSPGMSYFAIGAEKAATTTKQACPNECCAGETNYLDKACASGFECTGGSCIETISAPVSTTCGNNLIEANEKCDGTALAGQSCSSMGYASGTLACKSNCQFDTSSCVASQGEQKQTEGLSLPKLPFDWVVLIIMFVIAIIIGIIYFKFFTKK
jgi:PGF-pre-PGF domain-containing protein